MTLPDLEPLTAMDERLRQKPRDHDVFVVALTAWETERDSAQDLNDRDRLCRALAVTGSGYRILQRWTDAERDLITARAMATGAQAEVAEIRLAELDRCRDRPDAAIARLAGVLPRLGASSPLRSFTLQHLGKALCDAGRPADAISVLEQALVLRDATGDATLSASTRQALARARSLLGLNSL